MMLTAPGDKRHDTARNQLLVISFSTFSFLCWSAIVILGSCTGTGHGHFLFWLVCLYRLVYVLMVRFCTLFYWYFVNGMRRALLSAVLHFVKKKLQATKHRLIVTLLWTSKALLACTYQNPHPRKRRHIGSLHHPKLTALMFSKLLTSSCRERPNYGIKDKLWPHPLTVHYGLMTILITHSL